MKKSLLFVSVLVSMTVSLRAQIGFDTLYEKFPNYHYNWYDSVWDRPAVHSHNGDTLVCYTFPKGLHLRIYDTVPGFSGGGMLMKGIFAETAVAYIPDSSMRIVGVAVCNLDSVYYFYNLYHGHFPYTDNLLPETHHASAVYHVNIYDKNMNLLQSVSEPYIAMQPARHCIFSGYQYGNESNIDFPVYLSLRDMYLDYPMVMTDTFYISRVITYNDTVWPYNDIFCRWEQHTSKGYLLPYNQNQCQMKWEYYRYRNDIYNGVWQSDYTWGKQFAAMYPIVENPGDSCPQVHDIEVLRSGATKVYLRWPAGAHHRHWQVAYGPAGTPPEDCTVLDYDRRMSDLITLDPDSHYVAYVRAFCRLARDEWGDWSDPVPIWLNDPSVGINEAECAGVTVEVKPNPTSGKVHVTSTATMEKAEVLDAVGNVLRTIDTQGTAFTVDLTDLPDGLYLLRIHTPQGVATKKLTVRK